MRTSPISINSRGGFTFIEVMLVLVLLGLVMGLALPAFQAMMERDRDREMNRLAAVLQLARSEAILTRRGFRLQLDLRARRYWVEREKRDGTFAPLGEPKSFRPHSIPPQLELEDILPYGNTAERQSDRVVSIRIDSSGFIDPFLLHFRDGRTEWTFRVSGFTGHTELIEGYRDDL